MKDRLGVVFVSHQKRSAFVPAKKSIHDLL